MPTYPDIVRESIKKHFSYLTIIEHTDTIANGVEWTIVNRPGLYVINPLHQRNEDNTHVLLIPMWLPAFS